MSSGKESLKPPFPARVIAVLRADTMTTYIVRLAVDKGKQLGKEWEVYIVGALVEEA
jgi:hypothetical protein